MIDSKCPKDNDAPDYAIVAGVSAEVKKYSFDERTIAKLLEMEWWNGDEEKIEKVKDYQFRAGEYVNRLENKD